MALRCDLINLFGMTRMEVSFISISFDFSISFFIPSHVILSRRIVTPGRDGTNTSGPSLRQPGIKGLQPLRFHCIPRQEMDTDIIRIDDAK
jgi:hypothetical protein